MPEANQSLLSFASDVRTAYNFSLAEGCRSMSVEVSNDALAGFYNALLGQTCFVQRREHDWIFRFGERCIVGVEVPWRIIESDVVAYTDRDDGQRFGLPEIINGQNRANELLQGKQVISAEIDNTTADLCVRFDSETRIDLFNYSCGHEGWNAHFVYDSHTASIIALGGGQIAISKSSSWNPLLTSRSCANE